MGRHLKVERWRQGGTLAQAWAEVKRLFNEGAAKLNDKQPREGLFLLEKRNE